MKQPDEFDAFYQDARDRLLVQTFALTGDLAASRRAVRDAFIVAWHRWRKLQRLDGPDAAEAVVRPHAWRLAQRRHTARVFHREKDLDPDVKATLDALGTLTTTQRRALVLTQYARVTMTQMAREVGLAPEAAARDLQSGAAQLALLREVPTSSLPTLFEQVATSVIGVGGVTGGAGGTAGEGSRVRWPRPAVVRRAGAARRRTHTVVGVAVAVAAVGVSGMALNDTSGVRPTLAREASTPVGRPSATATPPPTVTLPESSLVGASALGAAAPGTTWKVARTTDNQDGSGLVLPCQTTRFADPRGDAALVRTFTGSGRPSTSGVQLTEASADATAAAATYDTTVAWFSGCTTPRVQLLATRKPGRVGDDAVQLVLRSWAAPVTTYVVGVARTGDFTTSTVTTVVEPGGPAGAGGSAPARPDREGGAAFLAAAVDGLCHLDQGGSCAPAQPVLTDSAPLPTGARAALLGELDLPPVTGVDKPWVGSAPSQVVTNLAASRCDNETLRGAFGGARFTHGSTRTFLVQGAGLPDTFGLTQTAAALPLAQAKGLAAQVRSRLGSCADRMLGTTVDTIADRQDATTSLAAWRVRFQVSDSKQVELEMAVVRNGTAVSQVGLVPAAGVRMSDGDFVALAQRALDRLAELPAPG